MVLKIIMITAALSISPQTQSQTKKSPPPVTTSFYVYNLTDQKPVDGHNYREIKSIASVTKLMTALVVLDSKQDLNEKVRYRGSIWPWPKNVTRRELIESLLIRSDNRASEDLAMAYPGGMKSFVEAMNAKALELNMLKSAFVDPSGLGRGNVSTAEDLVLLVKAAGSHPIIRQVSSSKYLEIERRQGKKITVAQLPNTNHNLLFEFDNIELSKTGWTTPAGRCLALIVRKNKIEYAIIILGEKNNLTREQTARNLINYHATLERDD